MATFLNNSLAALNRIFRFQGGFVSTNQVDLAGQVQLVHNISREAELGSTFFDERAGGYFSIGQDNVHGAANQQLADVDVYGVVDQALGANSADRYWAWLIHAGLFATAQIIDATHAATLSLEMAAVGNALADRDFLVARWNAIAAIAITGAVQGLAGFSGTTDNTGNVVTAPLYVMPLPLLIPVGGKLGWQSSSSAAGTVRLQTICWVGPIGVYPPGMA